MIDRDKKVIFDLLRVFEKLGVSLGSSEELLQLKTKIEFEEESLMILADEVINAKRRLEKD